MTGQAPSPYCKNGGRRTSGHDEGRQPILSIGLLLSLALALAGPLMGASYRGDAQTALQIDRRIDFNEGFSPRAIGTRDEALEEARESQPDLLARIDPWTGATRTLSRPLAYLGETGKSGSPEADARAVLNDFLPLLGLVPGDVTDLRLSDLVPSQHSGSTHVYLQQFVADIPVFNGLIQVHLNRDGRVLALSNNAMPSARRSLNARVPELDRWDALAAACEDLGWFVPPRLAQRSGDFPLDLPELSREKLDPRLFILPIRQDLARLVWRLQIHTPDAQNILDVLVDAVDGRVWARHDWVSRSTYRVYPLPIESPGHSDPPHPQDGRQELVDPQHSLASPLGWHGLWDGDGNTHSTTTTRGNNVHAYPDLDGTNLPPPGSMMPDCGSGLDCDFALDLTRDPGRSRDAAVTNLFYLTNYLHDVHYLYGFDEEAGNFQTFNFGVGGEEGDALLAEAQDGAGFNNANFATPPDGMAPRMQMYIWNLGAPHRDGDLDGAIVVHEYGHGISNRLVGGPSQNTCLINTQQPGEGLSDWWSLVFTHEGGDRGQDPRPLGTYPLFEATDGAGIRSRPYSTDPSLNDLVFGSLPTSSVPYGVGEVWAQGAWRVYWALVDRHGYDPDLHQALGPAGNQRLLLYVLEGLKNTPCTPTFVDVRDGILQAAQELHGGEDVCRLWRAFADFGMGLDSLPGGAWNTDVEEGFKVPEPCACQALEQPAGVRALVGSDGLVQLSWDPVPGAGGYEVHRSAGTCQDSGQWKRVARSMGQSAFVDPESRGFSYSYRIAAVDAQGDCASDLSLCAEAAGFSLRLDPAESELCAPGSMTLDVLVEPVAGFGEVVILQAGELPPGVGSTLEPSVVLPPGSALLTLEAAQDAASGILQLAVEGEAGPPPRDRHSEALVTVTRSVPQKVTLLSPLEGALEVDVRPTLAWEPVSEGTRYEVEVATDTGFHEIVFSAVVVETQVQLVPALAPNAVYFWRVRAENSCGIGPSSAIHRFSTAPLSLLLVDDDGDRPNVRYSYSGALDGLGVSYDVWRTEGGQMEPQRADLESYNVILWFSGQNYGGVLNPKAGPHGGSEVELADYLDSRGRCLAVVSQDYLWDMGGPEHDTPTTFMGDYLGIAEAESDAGYGGVHALGPFGGLGILDLRFPFRNYSDLLEPRQAAVTAFAGVEYDPLPAATAFVGPGFRSLYWGFPFEAIPESRDRQEVMERLLDYCEGAVVVFRDGFESGSTAAWEGP